MKMRGLALGFGIAAVVALGVACGSAPQTGDDDVFTVQVARVNADKSYTIISERQITRAQEIQENEAYKSGTLPVRGRDSSGLSIDSVNTDSNCAGSDNWLYDQQNEMGNRLCLYGSAPFTTCAAMNTFSHPGGGNWQQYLQSFYTGSETGYFQCGDLYCPSSGAWNTYYKYNLCATCDYTICFTN